MDELISTGLYMIIFLLAIVVSIGAGTVWDHFTTKEKCGAICFVLFLFASGLLIAYIGEIPNESNIDQSLHKITTIFK